MILIGIEIIKMYLTLGFSYLDSETNPSILYSYINAGYNWITLRTQKVEYSYTKRKQESWI